MSDYQRLEDLLRKHGFIVGRASEQTKDAVGDLLKDLWKMLDPQ